MSKSPRQVSVQPEPTPRFVHVAEDPDSVCPLQLQLMHSRLAEEVVPAAGRVDHDGSASTAAERGKACEPSDVIVRQPQFGDFLEVHQLPEGRLEVWINEQVPDSWPYLVQCDHACGGPEDHPEGLVDPVGEGHVQPRSNAALRTLAKIHGLRVDKREVKDVATPTDDEADDELAELTRAIAEEHGTTQHYLAPPIAPSMGTLPYERHVITAP